MTCLWADRIYMVGIFAAAIYIFGKRLHLRESVAGMERVSLDNTVVSVTDMNVTPLVRACMERPTVPFVGEPLPDSLPETVPGGYGGYLRQGVHTGQREDDT